jgi:hypothetical protein
MGKAEELQRQVEAVALLPLDIAAADQTIEHPVEFVRALAELLGDFRLGQAAIDTRQKLEDIETLVERRRAVAVVLFIQSHGFLFMHKWSAEFIYE